jgi:hypothetical protein
MNKSYKVIGLVILLIVVAILMMASASAGAATAASTIFTTFTYILGLAFIAIGGAIVAKFKK